jgi:hydroxyacylglutathione hydrolase
MSRMFRLLVLPLLASSILIGASRAADGANRPTPEIVQIKLAMSNVFLIKAAKPVLIDAGTPRDMATLREALSAQGTRVEDLALIVLTHAHSDHAGLALELRKASGAQVLLGKGDAPMAKDGHNDELKPTGFTARLLKRFAIDPAFPAFEPDLLVEDSLDLRPWGIAGRAIQRPGHTPGSLVVLFEDGRAVVGDLMLGGYLGGAILPHRAGEHYFHADLARNLENIRWLLAQGAKEFYLGHGGPVDRAAVIEAFGVATPAAPK